MDEHLNEPDVLSQLAFIVVASLAGFRRRRRLSRSQRFRCEARGLKRGGGHSRRRQVQPARGGASESIAACP